MPVNYCKKAPLSSDINKYMVLGFMNFTKIKFQTDMLLGYSVFYNCFAST